MDKSNLTLFGEEFITSSRDRSIQHLNSLLNQEIKAPSLQDIQYKLSTMNEEDKEFINLLGVMIVDNTLFNILTMFEQSEDKLTLLANHENIVEASDGLAGELFTEDGWISKFSQFQ
ncbi:epimerase [Listeria cossartiae]|uniref:epimerase n=1 Tax=Listeria cossartiae TaxID=2838249 RepID=UPI001E35F3EE|nr:epimerase [Listeria cossartiae]MCD2224146.1 epimerase [Listeria cossartiae]MCD2238823.1 epimerase [Listeria cossartiae]